MKTDITTLNLIYFSPTGTTQKIVREIGHEIKMESINEYNLTSETSFSLLPKIDLSTLTIIGVPVYSGRIPVVAIDRLQQFKANNALAVLVVVYGNRAYDDSLLELRDIVVKGGFKVVAAAAFIGEHSFSTAIKPIAKNRPDLNDLLLSRQFSQKIQSKIRQLDSLNKLIDLNIPGNFPYRERGKSPLIAPETDELACNKCKICEDICPTNAIKINHEVITDKNLCIWCCACIKSCPNNARSFENPIIDKITEKLFSNCSERKEPVFFI